MPVDTCLPCSIGDHDECDHQDDAEVDVSDGHGHTIRDCCDGHFSAIADRRAGI